MKKYVVAVFSLLLISFACNKNAPGPVELRIENSTAKNFTDVQSNGVNFGAVKVSAVTAYQSLQKIIDVPSAVLVSGTDTIYAGLLPLDFPSYITQGKYTMQIVVDTTLHSGYNCIYHKD